MTRINPARLPNELQQPFLIGLREVWERERKRQALTQTDIAHALGIEQSAFSQYLSGKITLSVKFIIKVCNILKVPPQQIYPEISDILPNRASSKILYKISDAETPLNRDFLFNPNLEYKVIVIDKKITWFLLDGTLMTLPAGSSISVLDPIHEGQWECNTNIEPDNWVIQRLGSSKFEIINDYDYRKLDQEKLEKVYILSSVRFGGS